MSEVYVYDKSTDKVILVRKDDSPVCMPDVYFDRPGTHHGIGDPATGEPIFITSKAHKAYEMKKQNLREVGDKVHGARNFDPISYRHAQASLQKGEIHGKNAKQQPHG